MLSSLVSIVLLVTTIVTAQSQQINSEFYINNSVPVFSANTVPLQGFNFSNLTGDYVQFFPSQEKWSVRLSLAAEPLNSLVSNRTEAVNSYALTFPQQELPTSNRSTWSFCAYVLQFSFPTNITEITPPSGATPGDCTPYLGDACVRDLANMQANTSFYAGSAGCINPISFAQVASCRARLGSYSYSLVIRPVMNWVAPDIAYISSNNTFENTTTRQSAPNATVHGLRSGQVFWRQGTGTQIAIDNTTSLREQADTLQFLMFTQSLSHDALVSLNAVSFQNYSDVRLVCARSNASYNAAPSSSASAERPSFGWSSALVAFASSLVAVFV